MTRRPRHDAVWYTPAIGSIVSRRDLPPPGGTETQVLMLARELARHGLRVAIIVFGTPEDVPPEVDGVTLIPRRPRGRKIPLVRKFIEVLRIWTALFKANAAVMVHKGMALEVGVLAMYAQLTRRRFVFAAAQVADFDPESVMRPRDRLLYEYGAPRADTIIIQTEEQLELCRRRFRREPRLIRSLQPLAPRAATEPEAFLWVGRLVARKRPLEYLKLARAVPEARFWMVGVPGNDPAVDVPPDVVAAEAAGIPNLELLAPRPRAEIEALMERAVASVNTAAYEGLANVVMEAWTRGVPALVLWHDPDGLIAKYGLGGFANGSFERFVELAREQWAGRHHRDELSERCRKYIAEHHSMEVLVGEWTNVLLDREKSSEPGVESPEAPAAHARAGGT